MIPERIELGSGVALTIIEDSKFKTNCISLRFLCPVDKATVSENALLLHVLKRGTERLPDMAAISRECQMLYDSHIGVLNSNSGDIQSFGFVSYPLSDRYTEGEKVTKKVISLIAEMLYSPRKENGLLLESYIEGEKKILSDRVRDAINNKSKYAVRRCTEEMGKNDEKCIPETGTLQSIASVTPQSLTKALERALSSYKIEIWCAGEFDRDELISDCKRLFVRDGRKEMPALKTVKTERTDSVNYVCEEHPVKQGKLCLGFTADLDEYEDEPWVFATFYQVFSSSPISKLFVNVREKLSLCYYCYALPDKLKGTVIVTSGIENDKAKTAEKAILNEIKECIDGNVTDEELSAAKMAIVSSLKAIYDDHSLLINWYFNRFITKPDKTPVTPEEFIEGVKSVSVSDIGKVASSLKLNTVYLLKGTLADDGETEE